MLKNKKLFFLCIAMIVVGFQPNNAAVDGGLGFCSGTATIGKCNSPNESNLDCLGQCPEETTCKVDQFKSGETTYWACACVDESGGPGTGLESSCCHLIVINQGGTKFWGARGGCPSCGTQGSCSVGPSGCQAVCN
jgi:hypothetical protein